MSEKRKFTMTCFAVVSKAVSDDGSGEYLPILHGCWQGALEARDEMDKVRRLIPAELLIDLQIVDVQVEVVI